MPEQTCSHCGHVWQSRKERPVKCSRCQNPLWRSARPKRRGVAQDMTQRTAVVDQDIREYPDVQVSNPASPTIPIEKDSLSDAKARAEALLRQLTV